MSPEVQAAVEKLPPLTDSQVIQVAALLSLPGARPKPIGRILTEVVKDGGGGR